MRNVTAGRPVMVDVSRMGGGGHWVLVVGRQTTAKGAGSTDHILDPGDNTRAVNNLTSRVQAAPSGSTGVFDNDVIAIT